MTMLHWLKHAFSVGSNGPAVPTGSQAKSIDLVCHEIVRRGMTLPAQMMLESSVPLHYLAGQMLRFVEPFLGTLLDAVAIRDFATFVEQKGAVEYLCYRLQEIQEAAQNDLPR